VSLLFRRDPSAKITRFSFITKLRLTNLRLSISSNQLIILSVFIGSLCPVAPFVDSSPNAAQPVLVSAHP